MIKPIMTTFRSLKQPLVWGALLLLTACAGGEPLPVAKGPWRALNVGYWTPTTADLNPQVKP